jgi:predicted RNA methylase
MSGFDTQLRMTTQPVFPAGAAIPLVYQYHLLRDVDRMDVFSRAIVECVRPGDAILELGCGTGILSFLAAKRGASVIAVERDQTLAECARRFLAANGVSDRVTVVCDDATKFEPPAEVDGVICEMMFTGLLVEPQWQVMRNILSRLRKAPRFVLPCTADLAVTPGQADFSYLGYHAPFSRAFSDSDFTPMSESLRYATLRIDRCFSVDSVDVTLDLIVSRAGLLNAIKISTETEIAPGIWSYGSQEFCWPFVFPVVEPLAVGAGDRVRLHIGYRFGGDYHSVYAKAEFLTVT